DDRYLFRSPQANTSSSSHHKALLGSTPPAKTPCRYRPAGAAASTAVGEERRELSEFHTSIALRTAGGGACPEPPSQLGLRRERPPGKPRPPCGPPSPPPPPASSAPHCTLGMAERSGRGELIASKLSATATMRAIKGMASPERPSG